MRFNRISPVTRFEPVSEVPHRDTDNAVLATIPYNLDFRTGLVGHCDFRINVTSTSIGYQGPTPNLFSTKEEYTKVFSAVQSMADFLSSHIEQIYLGKFGEPENSEDLLYQVNLIVMPVVTSDVSDPTTFSINHVSASWNLEASVEEALDLAREISEFSNSVNAEFRLISPKVIESEEEFFCALSHRNNKPLTPIVFDQSSITCGY